MTKGCLFSFRGERQQRIQATHGLLYLGGGNPGIPLRHPQVAVSKLARYHIQFNPLLAKPCRKCVVKVMEPYIRNAEDFTGVVKGHAHGFRGDIREEQVIRLTLGNGRQHSMSEGVKVDFLRLIVFGCRKQDARAVHILPLAPEQFPASHSGGGEQGENRLHFLRGGCAPADAPMIEDIMRNEIFHSTLDGQIRKQFRQGARRAAKILGQNCETFEEFRNRAMAAFGEMKRAQKLETVEPNEI